MTRKFLLCALLIATSASASASARASDTKLDLASPKPFVDQRARIEADLAGGEVYAEISRADASTVKASLDAISSQLGNGAGAASLSPQALQEVTGAQELVNKLLAQAEADSRMICRREAKTGSLMTSTQCWTAAERRRQRERSRNSMQGANNSRGTP